MNRIFRLFFYSFWLLPSLSAVHITLSEKESLPDKKDIIIAVHLDPTEKIIKSSIKLSSNSPYVHLSTPTFSHAPITQFLPDFHATQELFDQSFNMHIQASCDRSHEMHSKIHVTYLAIPKNTISEQIFSLAWNTHSHAYAPEPSRPYAQPIQKKSYIDSFQTIVQTTNNQSIRLFFIFLLGLLLSLTPCIYPMIPITIGILHRSGKTSMFHNLIGSLCYAIGLSTTFAIFGLCAALAGASFGSLLAQPIFIAFLILFITGLSLNMIGIIDIPIPSFLNINTQQSFSMSPFLSAFIFGLMSGTIASPCVSPGLALILTMVATMGNILKGFWLLFTFGIGLSTPLIIIGTFSNSLHLMPQAGMWMIEVKKILGFMMLATNFYYLQALVSYKTLLYLITLYLFFIGLYYILDAQKSYEKRTQTIKSFVGIIFLALAVFIGYKAQDYTNAPTNKTEHGVVWAENYTTARSEALQKNKLILIDFWANHCTICKAIEKKLFAKRIVAQQLQDDIIFLKIDCSSSHNEESSRLKHMFSVIGQPTILVIDPQTEKIIQRWSSEPYNMTPQEFISTIKSLKA